MITAYCVGLQLRGHPASNRCFAAMGVGCRHPASNRCFAAMGVGCRHPASNWCFAAMGVVSRHPARQQVLAAMGVGSRHPARQQVLAAMGVVSRHPARQQVLAAMGVGCRHPARQQVLAAMGVGCPYSRKISRVVRVSARLRSAGETEYICRGSCYEFSPCSAFGEQSADNELSWLSASYRGHVVSSMNQHFREAPD